MTFVVSLHKAHRQRIKDSSRLLPYTYLYKVQGQGVLDGKLYVLHYNLLIYNHLLPPPKFTHSKYSEATEMTSAPSVYVRVVLSMIL